MAPGGPALIPTLILGSPLFGEDATKQAVAQLLRRVLPPSAGGGTERAQEVHRTSRPTASPALLAGSVRSSGSPVLPWAAGLAGWLHPEDGEHAVNEDQNS